MTYLANFASTGRPMAHPAGAYPGFCGMRRLPVLDGMLVHRRLQTTLNSPLPFMYLGGQRHCESWVSCPRTQHNVSSQGSNLHHSIQSPGRLTSGHLVLGQAFNREFKKTTSATATSLNKKFNEKKNGCVRALYFFVRFFAVLFKTTTWNGQIPRCLDNVTHNG